MHSFKEHKLDNNFSAVGFEYASKFEKVVEYALRPEKVTEFKPHLTQLTPLQA